MIRRKIIRQKAVELLQRLGVSKPPVPVSRIAMRLGLRVVIRPFTDGALSGVLVREPGKPPVIGVNATHTVTRQRFTIAHELGHYILQPTEAYFVDNFALDFRHASVTHYGRQVNAEVEANLFAAELLMPADFVARDLQELGTVDLLDDETIKSLARKYQVSPQALTYRLINLGYLQSLPEAASPQVHLTQSSGTPKASP